jgi:hypothetical protein
MTISCDLALLPVTFIDNHVIPRLGEGSLKLYVFVALQFGEASVMAMLAGISCDLSQTDRLC